MKLNLIFVCALILAILSSIGVKAQTKIWGSGAAVGQLEGEFQNSFTQSTAPNSYAPTTWTALSVNQSNGASTPGSAYWIRSLLGYSQGAFAASPGQTPPPMPSPTQNNGVAIFDSDFMDNSGSGVIGTGPSPARHRGELISPRIDLSTYANTPLVVQFYSEYRSHQITELSVSMSNDDGVTWSTPKDYQLLQSSSSPGWVRLSMFDITASSGSLSQCRIRFVFDGNYYYAMIDDVSLEVAPSYDIAMGYADPSSNNLLEAGDFVKIGGNAYQAETNIDVNNNKEWFWGGKVINYGSQTLYPQDSANIQVSILHYDTLNNPPTEVYKDTMWIDTLLAGDETGVTVIDYLDDLNFLVNNGQGRYSVRYWVSHKHQDYTATNDSAFHTFSITGQPTSYISKARLAASDGRVYASRGIFPNGSNFTAFEYGSVYYFPEGKSNNLRIDSIDFRYRIPNGYTGNTSQTVYVNIYKVTDGSGATSSNGVLDGDELIHAGLGIVQLNGLGTTAPAGSYQLATVSNIIDPTSSSGAPMDSLADHGFYYISILQDPGLAGGSPILNAYNSIWLGVDDYNYSMNAVMSLQDTIINPSPLRIKDASGGESWYWTGFGASVVPSIGLHLRPFPTYSSSPIVPDQPNNMQIFPNPSKDVITVSIEYSQAQDVQYIITDASGRVVSLSVSNNVQQENQTFDISHLSAGVYFLTARAQQTVSTKKFIKQ